MKNNLEKVKIAFGSSTEKIILQKVEKLKLEWKSIKSYKIPLLISMVESY